LIGTALALLGPWLASPVGRLFSEPARVERDIPWALAWPPETPSGPVWHGRIDLAVRAPGGGGRIVNFASSMGITGGAGFAAYNASKEAVRALTRTAAREWAADGIVVNAIAPAAATHHGDAAKQSDGYRIFIENCPMKRQGDPELDIGPLAWFLCSDACRYLTGHTFMADGGAFMWA
jgi:NAD(P)-dependent dehydrogenase (short-subunit alcohol dehydrogenase family)